MTHTTSEFQLPIPFACIETTIPPGMTIAEYRLSRPQGSSWWHRLQRLLGLRNDLGLLSEEYDVDRGRMSGNFPQAFTHLALVGTAHRLDALASGRAAETAEAVAA